LRSRPERGTSSSLSLVLHFLSVVLTVFIAVKAVPDFNGIKDHEFIESTYLGYRPTPRFLQAFHYLPVMYASRAVFVLHG
jgi:hypothetical protein